MRVADVGSPSPTTAADKENSSKYKARVQGGQLLRNPRKGLCVHPDASRQDKRELMDTVPKTGGSNSGQKLVVHCFIYIYIAQCIGGRTVWIKWLVAPFQWKCATLWCGFKRVFNSFLLSLESSDDGVCQLGLSSFLNCVHYPVLLRTQSVSRPRIEPSTYTVCLKHCRLSSYS